MTSSREPRPARSVPWEWESLPSDTRQVIAWAAAVEGSNNVGSRGILVGLLKSDGPGRELDAILSKTGVTRSALYAALNRAQPRAKIDPGVDSPADLDAMPRLTENAKRILASAADFASDASSGASIAPSGIVLALLTESGTKAWTALEECLQAQGLSVADVRATYKAFLEQGPVGFQAALDQLVEASGLGGDGTSPDPGGDETPDPAPKSAEDVPVDFDLAGGVAADQVDPTTGIPSDQDRLDVNGYVAMFANAIAERETPLPLSIGLFGEWGSGKSYFMGLMRNEVRLLSESHDPRYVRTIKQIGFNAWHYADANLWASLGDEIFEQLLGPGETVDVQRKQLSEELTSKLRRRQELERSTQQAERETARLSGEIATQVAARRTSTRAFAEAAATVVGGDLQGAWKALGLKDDPVEQGRLLAQELNGGRAEFDELRRVTRGWPGVLLAGAIVVALIAIGVGIALPWLVDQQRFVGGGITVLATVLAAAAALVGRARAGLRKLRDVSTTIADEISKPDRELNEADRKLNRTWDELRTADASERVLRAQRDEVVERIAVLSRELAELSPGQRLYGFIAERAASDDYRRNLGLISTVRKDFEQLVELLADRPKQDGTVGDGAVIDRIVLYIDDLDRCSPRQVVDVLQAVQLLLAQQLFVVVVGVDPRWLLRSLAARYEELLSGASERADGRGLRREQEPERGTEEGRDGWQASADDYLEKIFNIPFALPRMSPKAYGRLLRSMVPAEPTGGAPADEAAQPSHPGDDGRPPVDAAEGAAGQDEPARSLGEEGSTVADIERGASPREFRPLTDGELDMLASLAPLVRTPREAKRMLNIYRLVRSTRDLSTASRFLGDASGPGAYQAVIVLLGLLTGHARLLGDVLVAPAVAGGAKGGLFARPGDENWDDFALGLAPRRIEVAPGPGPDVPTGEDPKASERFENDVLGPIPDADVAAWRELADGLAAVSSVPTLPSLSSFQRWAPEIARFSFHLSPAIFEIMGSDSTRRTSDDR